MEDFSGLTKAFGEEPSELEQHVEKTKSLRTDTPDIQQDYETSRAQLHNLVMKGQEAVDGILVWHEQVIIQELMKLLVNSSNTWQIRQTS